MNTRFRPWWYADACQRMPPPPPVTLSGEQQADVCIVGGGYTGLWTAILLKEQAPQLKIVIVERERCGSGASGRNGGCLLTWSAKFMTLRRLFGTSEALRLVKASEEATYEIRDFCRQHQLDAEVRIDGALYTATNRSQLGSMDAVMAELDALASNHWHYLTPQEARQRAGSAAMLEGVFSPAAGSVHPGKLALGLAQVARNMGIAIFEHSPMQQLVSSTPPRVQCTSGSVRAGKVVLAMNAWMATAFPQFSRSIAVVSSDMIITEPCAESLAAIGLDHGASICDSRIFVHYWRTSADGRLMLGKGGNCFAYGARMLPGFDEPSRHLPMLTAACHRFFPTLARIPLAASWCGPSDRSVSGFPFFGQLNQHPDIVYGFGYSGNGVGPSRIGAKILASLTLNLDNVWTRSGLCHGPRGHFPPEPIRWLGSQLVRQAITRKEAMEDNEASPWWIDRQLARFAQAAGKADKQ